MRSSFRLAVYRPARGAIGHQAKVYTLAVGDAEGARGSPVAEKRGVAYAPTERGLPSPMR